MAPWYSGEQRARVVERCGPEGVWENGRHRHLCSAPEEGQPWCVDELREPLPAVATRGPGASLREGDEPSLAPRGSPNPGRDQRRELLCVERGLKRRGCEF